METSEQRYWGPKAWSLLHTMAYMMDDRYIDHVKVFLRNVVLPCVVCYGHYQDMVEQMSNVIEEARDRRDIVLIVNDMHNRVNKRLGKPAYPANLQMKMWGFAGVHLKYIGGFRRYIMAINDNIEYGPAIVEMLKQLPYVLPIRSVDRRVRDVLIKYTEDHPVSEFGWDQEWFDRWWDLYMYLNLTY